MIFIRILSYLFSCVVSIVNVTFTNSTVSSHENIYSMASLAQCTLVGAEVTVIFL